MRLFFVALRDSGARDGDSGCGRSQVDPRACSLVFASSAKVVIVMDLGPVWLAS